MRKETEAGIDVSKDVLDVAARRDERQLETARFGNDAAGHQKLVRWLTRVGGRRASSSSRRGPIAWTSRSPCIEREA